MSTRKAQGIAAIVPDLPMLMPSISLKSVSGNDTESSFIQIQCTQPIILYQSNSQARNLFFPLGKYLFKVNNKSERKRQSNYSYQMDVIYAPPKTPKSPKLPNSCKHNKCTTDASTQSTLLLKFYSFKNMQNDVHNGMDLSIGFYC